MTMEFATKRDKNVNRYYLGIDTDNKTFSRERGRWYGRDDIVEIGKRDRQKMIDDLKTEGFEETDYFYYWN